MFQKDDGYHRGKIPMIHNQDLQSSWEGGFFFGVSELP